MGGEPTLRLDLPEIVREVVRHGHRPVLATNGLKLAHLDYCRMLKDAGLRYVLLSMNGADDDNVYRVIESRVIDSGKYARLKTRALKNSLKVGFRLNTGTIIARGVNEHSPKTQIDLVSRSALEVGVHFDRDRPWSRVTPILRMRSVGAIGRYLADSSCSYDEMVQLLATTLDRPVEQILQRSMTPGRVLLEVEDDGGERSALVPVETEAGQMADPAKAAAILEKAGLSVHTGLPCFSAVVWLLGRSEPHRNWLIADLDRYVIPPLVLNQAWLFLREKKPVGFFGWAHLTQEAECGLIDGTRPIQQDDWNAGERRLSMDCIARFGDLRSIFAYKKAMGFPNGSGR